MLQYNFIYFFLYYVWTAQNLKTTKYCLNQTTKYKYRSIYISDTLATEYISVVLCIFSTLFSLYISVILNKDLPAAAFST